MNDQKQTIKIHQKSNGYLVETGFEDGPQFAVATKTDELVFESLNGLVIWMVENFNHVPNSNQPPTSVETVVNIENVVNELTLKDSADADGVADIATKVSDTIVAATGEIKKPEIEVKPDYVDSYNFDRRFQDFMDQLRVISGNKKLEIEGANREWLWRKFMVDLEVKPNDLTSWICGRFGISGEKHMEILDGVTKFQEQLNEVRKWRAEENGKV